MKKNGTKKNNLSIKRRVLKWIKKFFIIGMVGISLIVTVGIIYEKSAEYIDNRKYTPPGQIINIDGHDMHIYSKGEGKATVVFASGWGIPCPYVEYYPLYNEISKQTRIAVYDRPGYGWSSISKTPRDIDTITEEVHELLEKSGAKPPYILVGHSLASLEVLRFAQLYKDEVKGIVLIDAGNPEYYAQKTFDEDAASTLSLKSFLNKIGVIRLLFNNSPNFVDTVYAPRNNFSLVPEGLKEIDKAMYIRNMVNKNKHDEENNIQINASKVVEFSKIGDIPLIILTSESEANELEWNNSQEALKNWSTKSQQRIIKGSNHNMHQYVPDIINKEILNILNNIEMKIIKP
ncbi:alpha/beta fold hydrolase [Brassicibacter mesophilus]|uniref:alpha/beta fold hydrolase n=1 Tax=Brassicibacter mesophilus TaxID=745119 RepID=UPI003D1C5CBD